MGHRVPLLIWWNCGPNLNLSQPRLQCTGFWMSLAHLLRFVFSYSRGNRLCFGFGFKFRLRYSGALVAALAQRAKLTLCGTRCAQVTCVRRPPSILLGSQLRSLALIWERSHPIRSDSIRFLPLKHMDYMFCFRSDKIRAHTRRPLHFGLVLRAAHCICSRWLGKALGNSENTPTLWQHTGLAGPILQCLRCYHTNCDYSIADQPLYTLKSKMIYRLYKNNEQF